MAIRLSIFLFEQESDTVTGLWCPKCLKPSGIDVRCGRLTEYGVTRDVARLRKCVDCNAPLPPEDASG